MAEEKLKTLYLMRMLQEETDPDHPLNADQICERMMDRYELYYERRTVYSDIRRLQKYGMKIGLSRGKKSGYYISERDFDLAELKLLVDAVQSSKFITKERSEDLIRKLGNLTSHENARQLQRQVFIYNRIKAGNNSIYANVDAIHAAIRDNRQIRFKYCEWTVKKELVQKRNGSSYIVSPWALTWDDENYYLVGYEDMIKHYRVDKMQEIAILDEARKGKEQFTGFDLASFAKKTFGMYGGVDRQLTLEGDKDLAGVVIDRFGTDVMLHPHGKDKFRAFVTITVSPQFFGWLAGLGNKLQIRSPEDIREEYKAYLKDVYDAY